MCLYCMIICTRQIILKLELNEMYIKKDSWCRKIVLHQFFFLDNKGNNILVDLISFYKFF